MTNKTSTDSKPGEATPAPSSQDAYPAPWEQRTKFRPGGYCDTDNALQAMQVELAGWREAAKQMGPIPFRAKDMHAMLVEAVRSGVAHGINADADKIAERILARPMSPSSARLAQDAINDLTGSFRNFSSEVLKILDPTTGEWAGNISSFVLSELELVEAEASATSSEGPMPALRDDQWARDIGESVWLLVVRLQLSVPSEHTRWVQENGDQLMRQISLLAGALGATPFIGGAEVKQDPQATWLLEFNEKLADYVWACVAQYCPGQMPGDALRARALYHDLSKHVVAGAPALPLPGPGGDSE
jgi:hypothetical protein